MSLKATIQADMKAALKGGDKERLSVIRMLLAAIQSSEIEARAKGALSDAEIMQVIEKLIKQRKESARQFAEASRPERAAQELAEADILQAYLPEQLNSAELETMLAEVIATTGAAGIKDMGKVMAELKTRAQGRADMGALSALVKARLSSN